MVFADTLSRPCIEYKFFAIFRHGFSSHVWIRIGGIRRVLISLAELFVGLFSQSSGVGERVVDDSLELLCQLSTEFTDSDEGVGDLGCVR